MERPRRVLLVEDEDLVRLLMVRILTRWGFEVVEQSTPDGALQHVRSVSSESAADLLVTDVSMPGMTGPELAARVQQFWPALRVLYVSAGDGGEVLDCELVDSKCILTKPFTPQELIHQVGILLEDQITDELDTVPTVDGG